jgi:hypothetical protein
MLPMETDQRLRIEIKTDKPVDLMDLTKSFYSIADEYKRFVELEFGQIKKEDVNLYVQEIRSGSIIADLIGVSPALLPMLAAMNNAGTVITFAGYLKKGYDFLLGRSKEKPDLKKGDFENLSGFVEPIAKDNSSQLNVHTVINGNPTVVFNLNSVDANAAQNAAKREIGMINEPAAGLHEKVVLYWYQVKKDVVSQTGDRVIIESIYPYPVKVIFANEKVKTEMILGAENPLTAGYLVDVSVETIHGKPVLYKVLKMHERIEKPIQYSLLKKE